MLIGGRSIGMPRADLRPRSRLCLSLIGRRRHVQAKQAILVTAGVEKTRARTTEKFQTNDLKTVRRSKGTSEGGRDGADENDVRSKEECGRSA